MISSYSLETPFWMTYSAFRPIVFQVWFFCMYTGGHVWWKWLENAQHHLENASHNDHYIVTGWYTVREWNNCHERSSRRQRGTWKWGIIKTRKYYKIKRPIVITRTNPYLYAPQWIIVLSHVLWEYISRRYSCQPAYNAWDIFPLRI